MKKLKLDSLKSDWQKSKTDIFWGEIAPCDHVVQIYENDSIFLDALSGFAMGGFNAGDCVIVIATENHLASLNKRIQVFGEDVNSLIRDDRYIPLNAEKTLSKFIINGWPDEELFMKTVSTLIRKARHNNYKVRAFGEMVALLWAQGHIGATVQLEHLWNKFCEQEAFCLFCAYPKSGFTQDANESIQHICDKHSKLISGSKGDYSKNEIFYMPTSKNIGEA
jgi:hypothetical protein